MSVPRVVLCILLVMTCLAPVSGQVSEPRPSTPASVPQQLARTGVKVNGSVIHPGETMQVLLGIAGPPDHVRPVRGQDQANDYVCFSYTSYGLSVHVRSVNNRDNIVDSIVVMQNNVKLVNVPFNVGHDYRAIIRLWGQPDQQEPGFMAYWKRGVYVAVGENGVVTGISLAEPGHVETQPTENHGMKAPGRSG